MVEAGITALIKDPVGRFFIAVLAESLIKTGVPMAPRRKMPFPFFRHIKGQASGDPLLLSFGDQPHVQGQRVGRLASIIEAGSVIECFVESRLDLPRPKTIFLRILILAQHPPHLPKSVIMATDFVLSCELIVSFRPPMRFVFLGSWLCLRLPSDPTSRWTPLPFG